MDKFDKKITNKILPKFQNAKEWSDLQTILKKLKSNLTKYKTTNMSKLTDKISLSKRLAQSLNNNLPSGVHETALDIYSLLFENIKENNNNYLGEDLALYSSGLFPFFSYASAQNKNKFLDEIIKKHYLTLTQYEFNLCLPGMLVSILPGIEEQNDLLQKSLKEIFTESRKKAGDSRFFGHLWSIILKNQRLRLVCIKYINDSIPIYKFFEEEQKKQNGDDDSDNNININNDNNSDDVDDNNNNSYNRQSQNEPEQQLHDSSSNEESNKPKINENNSVNNNDNTYESMVERYYPNISVLVLNSLKVLIEDSDLFSQRLGMDFIITHFPIYNTILNENEKISLLISTLQLLIKNDYSTTRRLLMWLMGPSQEEELEMGDPNIKYMIEILTKAIKNIFTSSTIPSKETLSNGIKIIDQLFKQQVKLVDYILESISINMISAIEAYWNSISNVNNRNNDEIITKIKAFYSYDPGYLDCLWNSVGKRLYLINNVALSSMNNEINSNTDMNSNINLHDINKEMIIIIKTLRFCLKFVELDKCEKKIKLYIPIISSLLRGLLMYSFESETYLDNVKPLITLALKFTKSLQQGTQNETHSSSNYNNHKGASNLTKYNPYSSISSADYNKQINTYNNKQTTKRNRYYNNNTNDKTYVVSPIKFSLQKGNSLQYILKQNQQNISLIEHLMENILHYHNVYISICNVLLTSQQSQFIYKHNRVFNEATELLLLIQEYVSEDSIPEWLIHLEKIIFCDNIDLSLEGIYYLLDLFMITSDNPIYENIKTILRSETINSDVIDTKLLSSLIYQTHVSQNCIELAMAKVWLLIDDQTRQKPVTDLLIKFYTAEQNVFQNTISNTFAINDLTQNVNAIKKFSQFWKLTSDFYPEIIFFENGECIFKMLDFLDHEHPLLRHLSKSWLSEAKEQFRKILDPLLKVLLDRETKWYISYQKQLYFTKEYDNRRIIEAFRKLKNIIINVPDIAINYFVNQPITQSLLDMDEIGKELRSVSKTITMEHYLELLVSISLRFIQGKFIESISVSFYRENFSVNAASCEFLEFLLSFIEPKSKVMNIAQLICEPVLSILQESLMINDEVMQVQLLNLLKVLLLSTKDEHLNFKQDAINIFNSRKLHDCIVNGIQINYSFVRGYFINFVESCLPIFSNILEQDANLEIAKRLINTTIDFLVSRVKIRNNTTSNINILSGNYFLVKNYLDQYQYSKILDENDVNVIIKGLKNILFHFLKVDAPVPNAFRVNWESLKKEMLSKSGTSFSFFGLWRNSTTPSVTTSTPTEADKTKKDIKNEIIEILQDVFASFCTCWINTSNTYVNRDYCLCKHGLLGNTYDDITTSENINSMTLFSKENNSKQLKEHIIMILLNIFIKNPFDSMRNFINLWQNENNVYIKNDQQYKLSLIEMLVSFQIPTEIVLMSINKNIDIPKTKDIKKSKTKMKEGNYPYLLNITQSIYEAKLCHLVYSYINYNIHLRVDKNLSEIWNEMLVFITNMSLSKSPTTQFWLYEIINIVLYKLPLRDTVNDNSIKKKLSDVVLSIYTKIMEMALLNKFDSVYEEKALLVTPLPPSVYEKVAFEVYGNEIAKIKSETNINEIKMDNMSSLKHTNVISTLETIEGVTHTTNNQTNNDKHYSEKEPIQGFYYLIHDYIESCSLITPELLTITYRNIGFITLKTLFYSIIKNVFSQDKLFPYFQTIVKYLLTIMSDKVNFNKIYIDLSTEFLHSLVVNASSITCTSCKQVIMDFFLEPDFFNMSRKNLRLWKDIISEFAHSYQNIINDLLDKMNQSGFFVKNTDQFNIKAMRRISFIIYSCPKDTFSTKLGIIMDKVKETITKYADNNPTLESEIFLMLRIMFLRFSHESLIEMIKALWPIIFTEIVSVINNKRKNTNIDLNLSSFKFVELLSVANLDEFCLYQWIFFVDVFNVDEVEENALKNIMNSDAKAFRPFALALGKNWEENCKEMIEKYKKKDFGCFNKRSLMIQIQKLVNKEELSVVITKLFAYVVIMNNFRNEIDLDIIEEVIEKDFLINVS